MCQNKYFNLKNLIVPYFFITLKNEIKIYTTNI